VDHNITLLELIWTTLAAVGLVAGLLALVASVRDVRLAYHPPEGTPTTVAERGLGLWLAVQWGGMTIVHLCLLVIGVVAMTLPTIPSRAATSALSGVCLITAEVVLVAIAVGYLVNRALVLRAQPAPDPPPATLEGELS
jgi:FtsH-binding integral membrane protein